MSGNAYFNPPLHSLLSPFYLLGELASLLVVQKPIHSFPWSANKWPPYASLSPFHTPHIKLQYLLRQHQQHQLSLSGTLIHLKYSKLSNGFTNPYKHSNGCIMMSFYTVLSRMYCHVKVGNFPSCSCLL